jgi:hypothetical protein
MTAFLPMAVRQIDPNQVRDVSEEGSLSAVLTGRHHIRPRQRVKVMRSGAALTNVILST